MTALPNVPTLNESGFPIVVGTEIWKDYSATNNFEDMYLDSAQFRKYIEFRREEFRGFLLHVGLLKK